MNQFEQMTEAQVRIKQISETVGIPYGTPVEEIDRLLSEAIKNQIN